MEFEAKTEYSSALITRAAWTFWMKKHRNDAVLSIIALIVVLYFFLIERNENWFVGFMLAVATIYVGAVYGGFLAYRRSSLALLRAMGSSEATWSFSENGIFCESGAGKAEMKWTAIDRLWRFREFWLLIYANGTYSTLPASPLSEDAKTFIEGKVRQAGGQVT